MESRLLTDSQCGKVRSQYGQAGSEETHDDVRALAAWLIEKKVISQYQAAVLVAGRPGPFVYGDYAVFDRLTDRLAGAFLAQHRPTKHRVMLQFLTGPSTQQTHLWAALSSYLKKSCKPRGPHIHRRFELVDLGSYKFIVSERLSGKCLQDVTQAGRLSQDDAVRVVLQAAQGLSLFHRNGQLHGDIRPRNLWYTKNRNVKLLQDPLSLPMPPNFAAADPSLRDRADYFAPELAQPGAALTPLTDIYALGCAFYELLTGSAPFAGSDVSQKMAHHAATAIQPLDGYGVSPQIAQIVAYMMAKQAGVRFQTIDIVIEQLITAVAPELRKVVADPQSSKLQAFEQYLSAKDAAPPAANPAAVERKAAERVAIEEKRVSPVTAGPAPLIETGENSPSTRGREPTKKKSKLPIVLAAVGVAVVVLGGAAMMFSGGKQPQPGPQSGSPSPAPADVAQSNVEKGPAEPGSETTSHQPGAESATNSPYQIVADDKKTLWASPTQGPPLELNYLAPGGQLFIALRPADLAAQPEGSRVLQAFGPAFTTLQENWSKAAGVAWEEIEQLTLAAYDNDGKYPRVLAVVRLLQPHDDASLLAAWGNPAASGDAEDRVYGNAQRAYHIPAKEAGRLFVMGPAKAVMEAASLGGARPPMRRELDRLRRATDADRHFNLLAAPNFLFADGREIFSGDRKKLIEPLSAFLGDDLKALLVSMHLSDSFYIEMRAKSGLQVDQYELASQFRQRMAAIPDALEDYIVSIDPQPFWKKLAFRFPQMVQFLYRNTRIGAEDQSAVINSLLPPSAAHNLISASELAIASTPGVAAVVAAGPAAKPAAKNHQQTLSQNVSLAFQQTSLEFAMRDLGAAFRDEHPALPFDFTIRIIGTDLQLLGITRNKQIKNFAAKDKPLAEALTAICMQANNVVAKSPADPEQQLVWVVANDPDSGKESILITTRDSAQSKGYKLPAVFQAKK